MRKKRELKNNRKSKPMLIPRITIPESILKKTEVHLREYGLLRKECLVFWSGRLNKKNEARMLSCILPKQTSTSISVDVDKDESSKIHQLLLERGEFLFAQVHSHPGIAFHSMIDNNYPMTHKPGFFSIVVPFFCLSRFDSLRSCRVFEYMGYGAWRQLSEEEVEERFIMGGKKG